MPFFQIDDIIFEICQYDPNILKIIKPHRSKHINNWLQKHTNYNKKYMLCTPRNLGGLGVDISLKNILYYLPLVINQKEIQYNYKMYCISWSRRVRTEVGPLAGVCEGVKKNGTRCKFMKKNHDYCLTHSNNVPLVFLMLEYLSIPHPQEQSKQCLSYDVYMNTCKYKSKDNSNMCGYHKHHCKKNINRRKQLLEMIDYRYMYEMTRQQRQNLNENIVETWSCRRWCILDEMERKEIKQIHSNNYAKNLKMRFHSTGIIMNGPPCGALDSDRDAGESDPVFNE